MEEPHKRSSMSREAMQMALDMLNEIADDVYCDQKLEGVITTLRQALEEKQEPVAEIQTEDMGKPFNAIRVTAHFYAEVPAVGTKLYKAPPKAAEWVGLTDDEVFELADTNLYDGGKNYGVLAFAKAVEQALKEKNI